ncbi:MAG: DUF1848 domain-containing protein [Tannerellaceae bacterium]|jgi:hypothetical protein|nr:DUF1848 domain-containing protein [Tannerellaceae bacterium]
MRWERITIINRQGEQAEAIAPLIISASRATDIPAFHAERFFAGLREGYTQWRNPFNGRMQYVAYARARLVWFWSKHPAPLLPYLPQLKAMNLNACLHYTLNDYEREAFEPYLPPLSVRIETFRRMVDAIGFAAVIWRFDPLLLAGDLTASALLDRINNIAAKLCGYTEKLVFSFADIACYRRVRARLHRHGISWRDFDASDLRLIAEGLRLIGEQHRISVASCAEAVDLSAYGIAHNSCIDGDLLARLFPEDRALQSFLASGWRKDSGQRPHCRCIPSKDIGEYGACGYGCLYCYANA